MPHLKIVSFNLLLLLVFKLAHALLYKMTSQLAAKRNILVMSIKNHYLHSFLTIICALVISLDMASAQDRTRKAAMGTAASANGTGGCSDQDPRCQIFADAIAGMNKNECIVDAGQSGASPSLGRNFLNNLGSVSAYNIAEVGYYQDGEDATDEKPGKATTTLRRLKNDDYADMESFAKGADFTYFSQWDHGSSSEGDSSQSHGFTMHLFVGYDDDPREDFGEVLYCKVMISGTSNAPNQFADGDNQQGNFADDIHNSVNRTPTPAGPGGRRGNTGQSDAANSQFQGGTQQTPVPFGLQFQYGEGDKEEVDQFMAHPLGWAVNQGVDLVNGGGNKDEDSKSPIEERDAE
jgi:hypothetical protein